MSDTAQNLEGLDRCHWVKVWADEEVLMPMCMGSALNGPAGCTCDVPESRLEIAERGQRDAESQVQRLIAARDRRLIQQQTERQVHRQLRARIRELEAITAQSAIVSISKG